MSQENIAHNIGNLKDIKKIYGTMHNTNSGKYFSVPSTRPAYPEYEIGLFADSTKFVTITTFSSQFNIESANSIAVSSLSERELFDFLCFLVLSIISLVSFIALIKAILTNYAVGEYSFNSEGVTFYTRVNTFVFRYDECAQIGLRYMKSRASKVYFVYLFTIIC